MKKLLFILLALVVNQLVHAQTKTINYNGRPVYVAEKTPEDFPVYFQNRAICEDNLPESNARARCVRLDSNGTGTFQNDYSGTRDLPPTPVKWYVVCNEKGETLKFAGADREQYEVIIEYTAPYYGNQPGDYYSIRCSLLRNESGDVVRALVHSKYYDIVK